MPEAPTPKPIRPATATNQPTWVRQPARPLVGVAGNRDAADEVGEDEGDEQRADARRDPRQEAGGAGLAKANGSVRKIAAVIETPENETAKDENQPIARSSSCS